MERAGPHADRPSGAHARRSRRGACAAPRPGACTGPNYTQLVSGAEIGLALSVLLACAVEAVEALTIVLAVGTTRSWSSALYGVGAAVCALAVLVAALGPALTALPINTLRLVVGALLLVFGLQWLRKAVLRAAG